MSAPAVESVSSVALAHRPTNDAYGELEQAFAHFNEDLFVTQFGARLPNVMLTMPRSRRCYGYFAPKWWASEKAQDVQASEIALNPDFGRTTEKFLSTLVHEMAHHAQAELPEVYGKSGQRGYHNKAFAALMETLGLMTSDTGKPGGTRTGTRMTHYIIEGGAFSRSYERLAATGFQLSWTSSIVRPNANEPDPGERDRDLKRRSKTKYHCAGCGLNAWAKPKVRIVCGDCRALLLPVG